jgi:hypothetical protein
LHACALAPVAKPGSRRTTTSRSCARDIAALPRAQDRQLQAQPRPHHAGVTSSQSRARAHDAAQSFRRFPSPLGCLSSTITGERKTPFRADRRNSARAGARRNVAPRIQHHDERVRKDHSHNRSSPAKNENSHQCERRRIRFGDPVEPRKRSYLP